jgi:CO/xanthine dehydrogenase Mo-binding subunit
LETETISELSFFDRQDVSVQMDPVRDVQDVSNAASERGGKHDVSVGRSVIFNDVSVNQSLNMHDVSVDQTQKFNQEVSVQMEPRGC